MILNHLLAEIDALLDGRAYSVWSGNVTGWMQWATYAEQGEW